MAGTFTPRLSLKQIESPDIPMDKLQLTLDVYSRVANTRLRALEKAGLTTAPAYKKIKDFSRDNRQFIAVGTRKSSKGKFKFSTKIKGRSREDIQEELIQLHKFLFEAKTSTVSGAKERKKNMLESHQRLKEDKSPEWAEYFQGMSEEEFEQFWNYANIKALLDAFGSKQVIIIIEAARSNNNIGDDLSLLNKALENIKDKLYEMSLSSVLEYVADYEPTGSVT